MNENNNSGFENINTQPTYNTTTALEVDGSGATVEVEAKENFAMGLLGAFLFSLVGAVLYFIIYQLGYIAGICGLVSVVLGSFGYSKFSGRKNSIKGIVAVVIISVFMIALAEFACLVYVVYDTLKAISPEVTLADAFSLLPTVLKDSETMTAVGKDLLIAYLLCGVASVGTVIKTVKEAKAAK